MGKLVDKIVSMRAFKARIAASVKQITEAEQELQLRFSNEYKDYLRQLGCASIYGHEFTGITRCVRLNVINATKEEREYYQDFPADWYVIEQINYDGIVICQNEKGQIFQIEPNRTPLVVANSILEYLEMYD